MGLNQDIADLREDIDELKSFEVSAKRQRVKDSLSIEIRRLETRLGQLLEAQNKAKEDSSVTQPTKEKPKCYDQILKNYSWDQSDKFVKIYLTGLAGIEGTPTEAIACNFEDNAVAFKASNVNGRNLVFNIKELAHKSIGSKSYHKVKKDMIVLFIAKSEAGMKWNHIKQSDKAAAEKPKVPPPSSGDNADPSASLMNMMKQMYQDGDDEMKRTIAKAWTESQDKSKPGMPGMGGMPGMPDMPNMGF